ncbi:MAG: hypothetical protein HN350_14000 [Phycisphaerales bacterium]|nr:hypothetical protein [Phycisphaerales bacterium]
MSKKKKRNWFVRLLRAIVVLLVLVWVSIWAASIWVVPNIARNAAREYLAETWSGDVSISSVEVNFFTPSYLRGITIRDDSGRVWLDIPVVRLDVVWDGFVPRLHTVRIDTAALTPQCVNGKCTIPFKTTTSSDDPPDWVAIVNDLTEIELDIGVVNLYAVNHASGPVLKAGGVQLPMAVSRRLSETNISFPQIAWRGGKLSVGEAVGDIGTEKIALNLSGGVQADKSIRFGGKARQLARENAAIGQAELVFKTGGLVGFDIAYDGTVQVKVSGDAHGDGSSNMVMDVAASKVIPEDFTWLVSSNRYALSSLRGANVKVHLERTIDSSEAGKVTGQLALTGAIGKFDAELAGAYDSQGTGKFTVGVTGSLCGGSLEGSVVTEYRPDLPLRVTIDASVDKATMVDLTQILIPDKVMKQGVGTGKIYLEIPCANPTSTKGNGVLFLDDAYLSKTPILADLFNHVKIKLDKSDLYCVFDLAGDMMTVKTGHLATHVWAVNFEPGGTIQYTGGPVDMYAIFLPLKRAGAILSLLDPLKLFVKQVLRLHITGTVGDTKIVAAPFSDLKKVPAGALELLAEVAKTGGQLGGGIINAILKGGK